jgi:hypothetical protein
LARLLHSSQDTTASLSRWMDWRRSHL